MSVKDSEQTNQLPLTAANILFDQNTIFHLSTGSYVKNFASVKSVQLKHKIAQFQLVMKGQCMLFMWNNFGKNLIFGDKPTFIDFCHTVFRGEDHVNIISEVKDFPSYLNLEILMGLILNPADKAIILFSLLKPFFTVTTYSPDFFYLLLLKWKTLKVCVLGCIQLGKSVNSIILKNVAQIIHVIGHADLFDLIYFIAICKIYDIRPYRETLSVFNLNPFSRNIHPCAILALVVDNIEVLESVES